MVIQMIPCKVSSLIRKVVHSTAQRDRDRDRDMDEDDDEDEESNGESGVANGVRGDVSDVGLIIAGCARQANNH